MEKSKAYSKEISSLHCNICNSNLVLKHLNQIQRIILCSNKSVIKYNFNFYNIQCIFPLESADMEQYIFDESKEKWDDYLSNIKKKLTSINIITTNDTFLEDKNNISKIEEKNNSFILDSFEEKDDLFSFNYDENNN